MLPESALEGPPFNPEQPRASSAPATLRRRTLQNQIRAVRAARSIIVLGGDNSPNRARVCSANAARSTPPRGIAAIEAKTDERRPQTIMFDHFRRRTLERLTGACRHAPKRATPSRRIPTGPTLPAQCMHATRRKCMQPEPIIVLRVPFALARSRGAQK